MVDSFTFAHNGRDYIAEIHRDADHGAPWEEEDGHGPVTGWERRDKAPGELILCEDRGARRFYDFAEACRIARRDGWGALPGRLAWDRFAHSGRRKFRAYVVNRRDLTAYGPTANVAISNLYAMHRATMTAREYAAAAARADYERLRQWCSDDWCYVGVVVRPAGACTRCGPSASLWGIESDADEYLREVATELAEDLEHEAAAA